MLNAIGPAPTAVMLLASEKKINEGTRLNFKGYSGVVKFFGKAPELGEGDWIGLEMDDQGKQCVI